MLCSLKQGIQKAEKIAAAFLFLVNPNPMPAMKMTLEKLWPKTLVQHHCWSKGLEKWGKNFLKEYIVNFAYFENRNIREK